MTSDKDFVRLRAACDRCHSQKLRCHKPAGAEECDRCRRADRSCLFSPFRQKKEPASGKEKARDSMNTQLFHLEENIDSLTEKSSRALVGVKRKRNTSTPPRDCSLSIRSPPISTFSPIDACFSFPEGSGSDWMCESFPLNEFGMAPTFDNLGFEFEDTFPSLEFTSPAIECGNSGRQAQKSVESIRFQTSPKDLLECTSSTALSDGPSLDPPQPPLWHNRSLRFEWDKPTSVKHPCNSHYEKDLIRQLSELSVGLYEHLCTVPPQSIHNPIPEGTDLREEKHTGYSIDETFRLTQELIDIYPVFINTFIEKRSYHTQEPSRVTPYSSSTSPATDLLSPNTSQHDIETTRNLGHQDHASILLLLSCHVRIIDLYGELFKHMLMCINANCGSPNFRQAMYMPPVIKIGTYTAPSGAAIPMQIILLLQQASRLSEDASALAAHLKESQNERARLGDEDAGDDAAILSLVTAEKVKRRARNMFQQLNSVMTQIMTS